MRKSLGCHQCKQRAWWQINGNTIYGVLSIRSIGGLSKYFYCIVLARIRAWANSTLKVTSQRSNQFGQKLRPVSKRLAGWLGCRVPPFLNGTRHPWLVTRHSRQARNMTTSRLWVNNKCNWLYSGLWTSLQCNVLAGIRTWDDSTQECETVYEMLETLSRRRVDICNVQEHRYCLSRNQVLIFRDKDCKFKLFYCALELGKRGAGIQLAGLWQDFPSQADHLARQFSPSFMGMQLKWTYLTLTRCVSTTSRKALSPIHSQ